MKRSRRCYSEIEGRSLYTWCNYLFSLIEGTARKYAEQSRESILERLKEVLAQFGAGTGKRGGIAAEI